MAGTMDIPVTSIIRVTPLDHCREQTLQWFSAVTASAAGFPGFEKSELLIVLPPGGVEEIMSIFRFNSYDQLMIWLNSAERQSFLQQGKAFFRQEKPALQLTGIEYWFDNHSSGQTPVRWKMIVLTITVIFTLLNTVAPFCRQMLLAMNFPALLISLLIVVVIVLLMTFLMMPFLSRILSGWLYQKKQKAR